jgi:signal transduction histidine kinase
VIATSSAPPVQPPAAPPAAAKPKVLIVDDELGPRESLGYLLSRDFDVRTADRVDRGLELARAEQFSVVVLDIRMPQKNGIQGLEELRRIDQDVSVIMLTGYGALASAQTAMSLGANEYHKKPFDVDVMLESVHRLAAKTAERRKHAGLMRQLEEKYNGLMQEQRKNQAQIGYGQAAAEMVHDICNPLVVAIGFSNMILDEAKLLPPGDASLQRMADYAKTLDKCTSFCLHLAESWRQSSRLRREPENFDLLETALEAKKVLFFDDPRIEVAGATGALLRGWRFDLTRVLQNLLKNALEAGASRVVVEVRKQDGKITLSLSDNGGGLPPHLLERVVQKGIESTKPDGTGLGLTICRHLIHAHGGEFKAALRPGGGTVFSLEFPAAG